MVMTSQLMIIVFNASPETFPKTNREWVLLCWRCGCGIMFDRPAPEA